MESEAIQTLAELFSPGRVLTSLVFLLLAWLAVKLVDWLSLFLSRRFGKYRLYVSRVVPLIRMTIWGITFYVVVVLVFSPQASAVIALTASAGLAIGLAAQDVIKNILSGILLLFDQPFRIGDMVRIDKYYGEVTHIGLRSVRIHTFDDSSVTIPNVTVVNQPVSNSNSGALDEMVVLEFSVPASLDVQEIKTLAWEAAASSPYIYLKKPTTVLVEDDFNRTFLTRVKVKAYVLDIRLERLLASDVLERIKKELVARGLLTESMVMGLLAHEGTPQPAQELV